MPPRVYVYVDETGDRGNSPASSPIFGMAAVVVAEDSAPRLRAAVDLLRSDFKVPDGKVMSWKEHIKSHDRRRRAAEVLGSLSCFSVCYVYAKKSELRVGSYRDDQMRFYNYVSYKLFKSALWSARSIGGGRPDVHIRFGHVRGHDQAKTAEYILAQASSDSKVPLDLLKSLRWVSADRYRESQAADAFGGFLSAATWPHGEFRFTEPSYLRTVWPRIHRSSSCAIPLGIMSMPSYDVLTSENWFPCRDCAKRSAT